MRVSVYPDSVPLSVGERLWVYKTRTPFARAQVSQVLDNDRYKVLYKDGTSYCVRHARVVRRYEGIVITGDTGTYRKLARTQPEQGDKVLEIGCCQGFATVVLARVADDVIAADKSSEYLAETVERVGNEIPGHEVKFINLDALDPDEEQWKGLVDRTIVFLDINGNRELRSVLKAMRIVLEKLNARLIVVKSQELHQLVKNEENIGEKLDKLLLQN